MAEQATNASEGLLRTLLRRGGIDRAVGWVIVGRSWALVAGPLTIFLIGTRLSAAEQGYYYTYSNILSLAMLFELGLGGWITRFASYEFAKLHWTEEGKLAGDSVAQRRLSSILRFAVRWYAGAALLVFVVIFPAGFLFFKSQPGSEAVGWLLPWLLVVAVGSCNAVLAPFFSLLEGCGLVAQMARLQFFRAISGNLAFWSSLLIGLGLLSAPILGAAGIICSAFYLLARRRLFVRLWQSEVPAATSFQWKRELLPLQWRTAVTFAAGYLAWQTANPILFRLAGPEEAGKLGMSLNLCTMIQAFGMAWLNTKVPRMSGLLAQGDKKALDALFSRSFLQAMLVVALGGITLLLASIALRLVNNSLSGRLLAPMQIGLLLLSTLASTAQIALVLYVRTYKQEPFVGQMIALGIAMPIVCYLTGLTWGATGMLAGMTGVNMVLGLWWTLGIFRSHRRGQESHG